MSKLLKKLIRMDNKYADLALKHMTKSERALIYEIIKKHQEEGVFHPYTCKNCPAILNMRIEDYRAVFYCPECSYKQFLINERIIDMVTVSEN